MEKRLRRAGFVADVSLSLNAQGGATEERWTVRFPPEWPGDAFTLLAGWAEKLRSTPGSELLGGTMIQKSARTAVGQMTVWPIEDKLRTLEIGYGVNPTDEGKGYATEGARAMVRWAVQSLGAEKIIASCLSNNAGSIRVLEKAGFSRTGEHDSEEGRLVLWEVHARTISEDGNPHHLSHPDS